MKCEHKNTVMWEPHLAGARKCNDCGWVKSPNRAWAGGALWFDEEKELEEAERATYERLKKKYDPKEVLRDLFAWCKDPNVDKQEPLYKRVSAVLDE